MYGGEVGCSRNGVYTHMVLVPKGMPIDKTFFMELLQHGRVKHKTRRGATVLYYMKGNKVNKRYIYDSSK